MVKAARFLDRFIAYLEYIGAGIGIVCIIIMTFMVTINVFLPIAWGVASG